MRVKCRHETINRVDSELFPIKPDKDLYYGVTAGEEYSVYGIIFPIGTSMDEEGTTLWLLSDTNEFVFFAPLAIFEIIDPRISKYWEAFALVKTHLTLAPPLFKEEYFTERLADREPEIVEKFNVLRGLMENEFK